MADNDRMPSAATGSAPALGLRERKKIRTRQAIRAAAYRLFEAHGFDATPVDRIAEEAEVSPSTVFRYFPTKEDMVLSDDYDALISEALARRPAAESPVRAVGAAVAWALHAVYLRDGREMQLRLQLLREIPALRSRAADHGAETVRLLACVLADRTGRPLDDVELRVVCTALLASLTEVVFGWIDSGMRDDLPALVDRALATLERGLTL